MKLLLQRINEHPKFIRAYHWSKLITITGSAQITIQIIGLICGIIIIRLLPKHEYALYTIANAMVGVITVIADGGISSGVLTLGGKVWHDKERLGSTMVTGLKLRKIFSVITLSIACPVLLYLLIKNGASWLMSILIVLSLIPFFIANLTDAILEIPFKLNQSIATLQKNLLGANLGRLFLTGLAVFIFPFSYIAILAAGIPRIFANYRLSKKASIYADLKQNPDVIIQKEIVTLVKRVLPGLLYFSVSGQITIWILSIFGNTSSVAQIGAVGRLTVVLNLFSILVTTLIVPRFAKFPEKRNFLLYKFIQVQLGLILLSVLILLFVMTFSNQILLILGKDYSGLSSVIVLMTISSCIGMMAGITYSISLSRGWVLPPAINIFGNLITQVSLIIFLDMTKIKNVLLFSILNIVVAFLMLFIYFIYRANKIRN